MGIKPIIHNSKTMFTLILIAALSIFIMPTPLILLAVLLNWKTIRSKPFAQNIQELGAAAVSAGLSLFVAVATRPFTVLDKIPLLKKNQDMQPILLVHGLYHNKSAWFLMKHRLNMQGFSNLNTWQYNSFITSYPELVIKLRQEIIRLHEKHDQKVILVGHSLGGLLISGASIDPYISDITAGLITMGTPFKGSILATVAPGRLGRSLHPSSTLFKGKNRIKYSDKIIKTAIISPTDEMVQPWENLEPDHEKWNIKRCPAVGHVAMLYSRRVSRMVMESIKELQD